MQWLRIIAAAVILAAPPLHAADVQPDAAPAPDQPTVDPCNCIVVPALMLVDIEILTPLSSAISKDGDTFPIRLASPIHVSGQEVIPAGATGLGEVIHAQKSGMGGGGGELLLAARFLEINGRRLRLRSFQAGRYGKNQVGTAMVTSMLAGPFGLAVKGKNTEFAAGSVASAKVAEAFSVPLSALPLSAPPPTDATSAAPAPAETKIITAKESNQ
jgi:hypothetical protein